MALSIGDKVSISGEPDFNSGEVMKILLSPSVPEYRGHIVKVDRDKVMNTPWGLTGFI